jgi:hypothetical protein
MPAIAVPFHRYEPDVGGVFPEIGDFAKRIENKAGYPVFSLPGQRDAGNADKVQYEPVKMVFLGAYQEFHSFLACRAFSLFARKRGLPGDTGKTPPALYTIIEPFNQTYSFPTWYESEEGFDFQRGLSLKRWFWSIMEA